MSEPKPPKSNPSLPEYIGPHTATSPMLGDLQYAIERMENFDRFKVVVVPGSNLGHALYLARAVEQVRIHGYGTIFIGAQNERTAYRFVKSCLKCKHAVPARRRNGEFARFCVRCVEELAEERWVVTKSNG